MTTPIWLQTYFGYPPAETLYCAVDLLIRAMIAQAAETRCLVYQAAFIVNRVPYEAVAGFVQRHFPDMQMLSYQDDTLPAAKDEEHAAVRRLLEAYQETTQEAGAAGEGSRPVRRNRNLFSSVSYGDDTMMQLVLIEDNTHTPGLVRVKVRFATFVDNPEKGLARRHAAEEDLLSLSVPTNEEDEAVVREIVSHSSGLDTWMHLLKVRPLETENYVESALAGHNEIKRCLAEQDLRRGRLFIYRGPSGTGKTHLLLDLFRTPRCTFVRVTSEELLALSGPSGKMLLHQLNANRANPGQDLIVLVVDEADMSLVAKRDGSNAAGIAALLNYGDGLTGMIYRLAVVLTTNTTKVSMDSAIRRQRLNVDVEVPLLSKKQATAVWIRELTRRGLSTPPPPPWDGAVDSVELSLSTIYSSILDVEKDRGLTPPVEASPIGFRTQRDSRRPSKGIKDGNNLLRK